MVENKYILCFWTTLGLSSYNIIIEFLINLYSKLWDYFKKEVCENYVTVTDIFEQSGLNLNIHFSSEMIWGE